METRPPSNKKELQSLLGKVNFLRRFISNLSGKTKVFSPLLRLKKEQEFRWNEEHQKAFDEIKVYLAHPPVLAPLSEGKQLKLYISASDSTIAGMLAQDDENGIERVIYYLSRMLVGAETRYIPLEKLCLSLYVACTKLKYYIRPRDVVIFCRSNVIKYMLSKPVLHSRVGKWALALTKYSLTFEPLKSIKGQVIVDFLADHSKGTEEINFLTTKSWELFFDGSKYELGTGIGLLIISPEGIPTKLSFKTNTGYSNNETEYQTITTDQGTIFTGRKVTRYAESRGIKLITSTPYYAQANGQVEAANKLIIGLIKSHISGKPRSWHETLVQILWAHRNSPRDATKTTPYKLVYGHDAILPLDINSQSIHVQKQNDLPIEDYWNLMYDELIFLDEERLIALQSLVQQKERVEKSYNKKVKAQRFRVGDLVLKVILPMDQKSRYLGKWSYNWEGPFIVEQVYSTNAYVIRELNSNASKVINGKYLKCFHKRVEC
uniref:Transposon Ty3-G Gag-Pol polyprotein n=1 Tax=Cajanus cajan TaxID=3821 RepID=A0A151TYS1_CAJCA|nr:Transposon Ty3-G Gag-Pol polyprotein [Cajanus cajan]